MHKISYRLFVIIFVVLRLYGMESENVSLLQEIVIQKPDKNLITIGIKTDSDLINALPADVWREIASYLDYNDKALLYFFAPRIGVSDEQAKKIAIRLHNFLTINAKNLKKWEKDLSSVCKSWKHKESRELVIKYLKILNSSFNGVKDELKVIHKNLSITDKIKLFFETKEIQNYRYINTRQPNSRFKNYIDFWTSFDCSKYVKSEQQEEWGNNSSVIEYGLISSTKDIDGLRRLAIAIKKVILLYESEWLRLNKYRSLAVVSPPIIFCIYYIINIVGAIERLVTNISDEDYDNIFFEKVWMPIIFLGSYAILMCIYNCYNGCEPRTLGKICEINKLEQIYEKILKRFKREKLSLYEWDQSQLDQLNSHIN